MGGMISENTNRSDKGILQKPRLLEVREIKKLSDNKFKDLERRLELAEGKMVILALTTESIYRSADLLNGQLGRVIQKISYLLERIDGTPLISEAHSITSPEIHLTQARCCVKEYLSEGSKSVAPYNEAKPDSKTPSQCWETECLSGPTPTTLAIPWKFGRKP